MSMSKRRNKVRISHMRMITINRKGHNHNQKVRNLARMLSIGIIRLFMMVRRYSSIFNRPRNNKLINKTVR